MITTRLRERACGSEVVIATYHMPCMFYAPKVMTVHAALAAKRVHDLANGSPYVLAGDFNIKPNEGPYCLLTTGQMPVDSPAYIPEEEYIESDSWRPDPSPMRSAYKAIHGSEPEFTNFAQTKGMEEPFVETLDYIFCSEQIVVEDVPMLVGKAEAQGPYPSATEPSDHVLLTATLKLP
eukprot:scaffold1158_cov351-Prasinococcus_capsulatus_cf.AAC.3